MDFIIFFLIGLGVLFLSLIVLGLVIYIKVSDKSKIRVNILLKSKTWDKFKVKTKNIDKNIVRNNQSYIFDSKCVVKGKYLDDIYYYEGNTNPINFDFEKLEPQTYTSRDLQTILDSDLIEKLFSEKRLLQMELMLYICVGASVICLLAIAGLYLKTFNIANENNRVFLTDVIKTILTGGK